MVARLILSHFKPLLPPPDSAILYMQERLEEISALDELSQRYNYSTLRFPTCLIKKPAMRPLITLSR